MTFKLVKGINPQNGLFHVQNVKVPTMNIWVTTKKKFLETDKFDQCSIFHWAFILMLLNKIYKLWLDSVFLCQTLVLTFLCLQCQLLHRYMNSLHFQMQTYTIMIFDIHSQVNILITEHFKGNRQKAWAALWLTMSWGFGPGGV